MHAIVHTTHTHTHTERERERERERETDRQRERKTATTEPVLKRTCANELETGYSTTVV